MLEQYLSLSGEAGGALQDIALGSEAVRIGNNRLCLHTLSDTDDLPATASANTRYEKLSTDRSDCRLSFAAPVGLLLSCNHIYNQYLFLDNSDENLRKFEKSARNMRSLARYSRANQINKAWIEKYLNPDYALENLLRVQLTKNQSLRFVLLDHHSEAMTPSQNFLIFRYLNSHLRSSNA